MLLSPVLRKIVTAALVLPAGVVATSSYADCSSAAARDVSISESGWAVDDESGPSGKHRSGAAGEKSRSGKRLSRRAFYGDAAAVPIIDLSADR